MLTVLQTALEVGLIYGLVALALFISFSILNIADLSTDGCFTLGCAVGAMLTIAGHPILALFAAMAAGMLSGYVTAFLQTRLGVESILAGIISNTGLYTINLAVMGFSSNVSITGVDTVFSLFKGLVGGQWSRLILLALIAAVVSIGVKEGLYWYTIAAAKRIRSVSLKAEAWHHRSDALSSIGSFAGVLGARLGVPILDPIASIVICLFIFKVAWGIFHESIDRLVDRACDPDTVAAMRAFQLRNGLTGSGNGDTATYTILYSVNAITAEGKQVDSTTPTVYTNLKVGATGDAVLRLQQALSNLRYTVTINGTYDETTRAAVLAFQKRNGLAPDGIAGVNTQTKLYTGDCVTGDTALPDENKNGGTGNSGASFGNGPAKSQIKLQMWYTEIKPTIKSGQTVLVYEPSSGSSIPWVVTRTLSR